MMWETSTLRTLANEDLGTLAEFDPFKEDAMEVDFDAGVEPVLVRRGTKRSGSMREERADQTDMEVCPDTTGECCNRDAVETMRWHATVGGIKTEQISVQECEMSRRCHKYEKSSMRTVISTTTSHKAKRDGTQPIVVTLEYADAMRVPEHYASTVRTRALRSVISRMMPKCRTGQFESCITFSAFFHAQLERGVWVKPPKGPRLSDGRCQHPVKALPLLSLGVSSQWLPGSVRVVTDAKCVENLAGLSAVRGLQPSSRASGRGQRGVAEATTAAETMVHHEGTEIVSSSGQTGLICNSQRRSSLMTCMQTPSMLSMLKLRRFVWYLVGGTDLSPFFAYSDEPSTFSVRSGDAMSTD